MGSGQPRFTQSGWAIAVLAAAFALPTATVRGQAGQPQAPPDVVARGVTFLQSQGAIATPGEAAIAALALAKAGVARTDPALSRLIQTVDGRFAGTAYAPEKTGGHDIYEAAVTAMMLVTLEGTGALPRVQSVASYILARQKGNGSWDYANRTAGDSSITQYAILGLWEAASIGAKVPPATWDRAAKWYLSVQSSQGSWSYHRDEPQWPETISMTAAAVGSLLICKRQLEQLRGDSDRPSQLLRDYTAADATPFKRTVSLTQLNQAVDKGIDWIARRFNFGTIMGQSDYYGLYGIERIGALLNKDRLSGLDWWAAGLQRIATTQQGNGQWTAQHGDVPNSAWALMFLTRATKQSVRRVEIQRLGSGTLLGGRGLPDDLSTLSVAQGRVIVQPLQGAVDEMIRVLEDPRSTNAESALAGLIDRYDREGAAALVPAMDRLQKLMKSPDAGLRQTAAWALGRSGQIDVVPTLIDALADSDPGVVAAAKGSLQFLSRKLDDLGPPPEANDEERRAAAKRWRDWFESVRRPPLEDQVLPPLLPGR